MEAVAIIAPFGTQLSRITGLLDAPSWLVEIRSGTEAFIQSGDRRAYLVQDDHLMQEYSEEEIDQILRIVPNPIFFALDFNDLSLAKEVLARIADQHEFAVDDTHGTILRGTDFARRLKAEPTWDWRSSLNRGTD
jgi:hypothetical protein